MREDLAGALLAACAAAGLAALGIALVLQHQFAMAPCPWCVFQRLILLAIVASCALGAWVLRARVARLAIAVSVEVLASAGAAAALWQHFVAARSEACGLTFADRAIMALSLHEIAPWMFYADAPCSEANLPLLGIPFAFWSFALFMLLGAGAVTVLILSLRSMRTARA